MLSGRADRTRARAESHRGCGVPSAAGGGGPGSGTVTGSRCLTAARVYAVSLQLWSALHGYVMLAAGHSVSGHGTSAHRHLVGTSGGPRPGDTHWGVTSRDLAPHAGCVGSRDAHRSACWKCVAERTCPRAAGLWHEELLHGPSLFGGRRVVILRGAHEMQKVLLLAALIPFLNSPADDVDHRAPASGRGPREGCRRRGQEGGRNGDHLCQVDQAGGAG